MLDMKRRFNIKSRNKTKENNEGIKDKEKLIKKISKKSITIKGIVLFCAFEMIFTTATFPFLLLHGPFETAKKTYVGAAMGSMTHQYLATFFLSGEEIGEIIGDSEQVYTDATDVNAVTVNGIKDDTIELYEITDNPNFSGYYLIVKDPTRVKIGVTSKIGEEGETTTTIAENNNAIAAINGGAFIDSTTTKWTGTGGIPDGIIMSEGEVIFNNYGDTGKTDVFGITKNGVMIAGKYSYEELKELDVQEAVSYGPSLIINGNLQTISLDTGISPRTAIGQKKDGSIILLVIDGRKLGSQGATAQELQEVLQKLGAVNAFNLDGGKSTTMYYEGEIINTPSYSMGERSIATAVVVR